MRAAEQEEEGMKMSEAHPTPAGATGVSRRRFLERAATGIALSGVLPLLQACGGSSQEHPSGPARLRFVNWVSAEAATKTSIDAVIAAFEKLNPSITIDNQPVPFDNMRQQLIIQSTGGNPPDVMQLNGSWPQELGAEGLLLDLSSGAGSSLLGDNYQGGLQAGEYGGKLYALPLSNTPHGFWFNKQLMERAGLDPGKPPASFEELGQHMAQIKSRLGSSGVYPIGIDTTKVDYALTQFWPYFFAFGARPLYGGKAGFDRPEVRSALSWLQDSVKKGYTPVGQQIKDERELMAKGQIVYKLDGPYLKGILQSLNPALTGDAVSSTFGVAGVPRGPKGDGQTLADLHQVGISSKSRHAGAAWKFVRYLIQSTTSIEQYMIPYGVLPPLRSELEQTYRQRFQDQISQAFIKDVFPKMVGGPYGPRYSKALPVVIDALQRVAVQLEPVPQVAADSQKKLQAAGYN
jgi:multiple sugar transport system substrate-binding protein